MPSKNSGMCLFNTKKPTPASAPAPAPAPAPEAPTSPALNEAGTEAKNASAAVAASRRGRNSLRIDLNVPSAGSGLTIQK